MAKGRENWQYGPPNHLALHERTLNALAFDWIVGIGAISMGLLIGWLTGVAFVFEESLTVKTVKSVVSVLAGGSVLGLFHFLDPKSSSIHEIWLYPVGLLVGFAVGFIHLFRVRISGESWRSDVKRTYDYLATKPGYYATFEEVGQQLMILPFFFHQIIAEYPQTFYTCQTPDGALAIALRTKASASSQAHAGAGRAKS